ncbi:MAG: TetR/AcrR family transcriptional regulator [Bacteroidales bacterium]|nr:TetR/AcrR family transcriptional regulator [Bacteroidales bacterium]
MDLRDKIVTESTKLFATFGLKAVSMDDIAKNIGISKRTLYETFSSKDELLAQCMKTHHENAQAQMMEIYNNPNYNFTDVIINILFHVLDNIKKANPIFYQDLQRYNYQSAYETITLNNQQTNQKFIKLLERGVAEGFIRKDINLKMVVEIILNQESAVSKFLLKGTFNRHEILANVFLMTFRGISTIKGIEEIDRRIEQLGENPLMHNIDN